MQNNKIPSIDECYKIMSGKMLPNVIEHSKQVMRVALAIVNNLKPNVDLDKNLIIAASLLHDINKTESINSREPHDIKGGYFIKKLGYNNVAKIIEEHVILKNFNPNEALMEKEIVFYADKRVMHNKIVSVDERIEDILLRYGKTKKRRQGILKNKELILDIEKKINSYMKNDINEVILGLNVSSQ